MARKRKIEKFVAFSCTHVPLHDEGAIAWLIENIEDVRPHHVVHLGDWLEASAASRFQPEDGWDLVHEYRTLDQVLRSIRDVSPYATHYAIPGNHDWNILTEGRIPLPIRDLTSWKAQQRTVKGEWLNKELLTKWKIPCEYEYSRSGALRLGQVTFTHGYVTNVNAGRDQSVILGDPWGLLVYGHTHRPEPVTRAKLTGSTHLPYWYANAGCLTHLRREYARRMNTSSWGHGCVVGEIDMSVPNGRSQEIKSTREWSAETRIRNAES